MCGVCGIICLDGNKPSKEVLSHMLDAIRHRGPDGANVVVDGCIALGHCRLAVLDLTDAAAQPMSTSDKLFTIVYNGEIYNFEEIRRDLIKLGHTFTSRSDTEVILHAYIQWGAQCVTKFNGMFVFVIYDVIRKQIFIARDRYGMKPLYYTIIQNDFLFSSEAKAFLRYPQFCAKLDYEALLEYFTFQNILTDKTLLHNVYIFPPGHYAILPLKNTGKLTFSQYWDYCFDESKNIHSDKEYEEELTYLIQQAVQRQLQSDVELGTYLSGGMDSGSITALASKRFPYIKSFTCGFDLHSISGLELAFDERNAAEAMSYLFKTEHYEMVLKSGDMERVFPRLAWHIEEPRTGQSYPNFCIAHLVSKFVKVVLAGTGSDELFGGYPWRYYRALGEEGENSFEKYIDRYYLFWQRLIPNRYLLSMFKPIENHVRHVRTRDIFRNIFGDNNSPVTSHEESINRSLYFEAKTFLHGLLVVEDKLSMAHSLETRLPFLDNDLVDFAMRLPVRCKIHRLNETLRINENESAKASRYYKKTNDGKWLLRRAMEQYVPTHIIEAAKQGFSAPDASWFRGESIDFVRRYLFSQHVRLYEYFDRKVVHELVTEHLEGNANRRLFIWSLLSFEEWLHQYLP